MTRGARGLIALAASAAALISGQAAIGSAQAATTINVNPASPTGNNSFPFGQGAIWPQAGFIYKDIPAFDLKVGDTIAFDLGAVNDVNVQLQISMAPTTSNGGVVPTSYTTVVSNTQTPTNPKGDAVTGNYELGFTAEAPFNFPGGGLIIRFSNPSSTYAADTTPTATLTNGGSAADSSGFFVERFYNDGDGLPTYDNFDTTFIGGFRLTIQDLPPPPTPSTAPTTTTTATPVAPKKKRCKKKRKHRAAVVAKKKCKKKRR
jgi:hypothetical protein